MNIAGIVLAGGRSSRMGEDKASLLLADETLLSRAVSLLEKIKLPSVFVSGQHTGFNCITDQYINIGPLGGIAAASNILIGNADALFILPVDMPLISEKECLYLLKRFQEYPQGVYYQQVTFPLILPLTTQLMEYLAEAIASTDNKQRSLYRLIETLKLHPINYKAEDEFRFQNSNTPQQWADCLTIHASIQIPKEER